VNNPGGRFEMSPDVLASQLREWQDLRADLVEDVKRGKELEQTPSSGNEAASKTVANLACRCGTEFLRHNEAVIEFVDKHIKALTDALGTYVGNDENARLRLRGQG
jgi:hypothetical protein